MKAYIALILSLLLITCSKRKEEFRDGYLAGRLTYYNPNEPAKGYQPLSGGVIKLSLTPSDTLNYIMSTTTDKEGYFTFQSLEENKEYLAFFEDSIAGLLYKGNVSSTATNTQLKLLAQPDTIQQNGINVSVQNPAGEPVSNANICVFNNALSWNADTCIGSLFTLNSGTTGTVVKYKLPTGQYYFLATAMIGEKWYRGKTSVGIKTNGITPLVIKLEQHIGTGFELTAKDLFNSPVNNAEICVFSNYTLFTQDTCLGSIFTLKTDMLGKVSKTDLKEGKYYLRSTVQQGTVKLKSLDSVTVIKDSVTSKSILLH